MGGAHDPHLSKSKKVYKLSVVRPERKSELTNEFRIPSDAKENDHLSTIEQGKATFGGTLNPKS
jgi:hypothetical protein